MEGKKAVRRRARLEVKGRGMSEQAMREGRVMGEGRDHRKVALRWRVAGERVEEKGKTLKTVEVGRIGEADSTRRN